MSIYKTLIESVIAGKPFKINLKKKNLVIGRKTFIKEGVIKIDDVLIENSDFKEFNIFTGDVEHHSWKNMAWLLYDQYYYSVPSKTWRDSGHFKAIDSEQLSLSQMVFGVDRHVAQAMLEGYILLGSLAGWIKWNENEDHWFWQYEDNKNLVVLREWIETK